MLAEATEALAMQPLPPNVVRSDRPLVVVPTGVLHGVPWTALDALGGRAVAVSPSLSAWSVAARAAARGSPIGSLTVRARGASSRRVRRRPGAALRVGGGDARPAYDQAVVLTGSDATAEACLDLFGRSEMVHLRATARTAGQPAVLHAGAGRRATHGLRPGTGRPDARGRGAVGLQRGHVGGDQRGHAARAVERPQGLRRLDVVAPLTPVNDERVTAVMQRFHDGVAAGLRRLRRSPAPPAPAATSTTVAAAFVVIGA